jgi:Domain of unknown function (DUF5011)
VKRFILYSFLFLLFISKPVSANEQSIQIVGVRDRVTLVGETLDYKEGLSVVGEGLTIDQIMVDDHQVNLTKPGTYFVYFFITDSKGNMVTEKARVVVLEQEQDEENNLTFRGVRSEIKVLLNSNNPDYLRTATAWDGEQEITDKVLVDDSHVDLSKADEYPLFLFVSNSNGHSIYEKIMVQVVEEDNTAPILLGIENNLTLTVHQEYDFLKDVQAYDDEWGDLTSLIELDLGNFDINQTGEYTINYSVKDGANREVNKSVNVHVVDDVKPTIESRKNLSFKLNTSPQLFDFFTVSDNYDELLELDVQFMDSNVDMSKVGSYLLKVQVSDQAGNTTIKDFVVYVYEVEDPSIFENPFILGSVVAIFVSLFVNFFMTMWTKRRK